MTPKTISNPLPAPSTASERVKQLASFSKFTFLLKILSKSCLKGLPFNHIELAFLIRAVSFDIAPGIPIPTDSALPCLSSK